VNGATRGVRNDLRHHRPTFPVPHRDDHGLSDAASSGPEFPAAMPVLLQTSDIGLVNVGLQKPHRLSAALKRLAQPHGKVSCRFLGDVQIPVKVHGRHPLESGGRQVDWRLPCMFRRRAENRFWHPFFRQRYGIVGCFAPDRTFVDPQCGQCGPFDQRCSVSHRSAVSLSGNVWISYTMLVPFLNVFPARCAPYRLTASSWALFYVSPLHLTTITSPYHPYGSGPPYRDSSVRSRYHSTVFP